MSGILGFWNHDGAPADPLVLRRMAKATEYRAFDGTTLFVRGPLAVAVQALPVSPETEDEQQPYVDRSGSVFAFDGSLHNRDELASAFSWDHSHANSAPDVVYVAEAYDRWGEDFVEHLNGEFVLVAFDIQNTKLILARDLLSTHPLYYAETPHAVLFGSEIKNVLAHGAVLAHVNDEMLADIVMVGDPNPHPETCFRGVMRVMPGEVLIRDRGGWRKRLLRDLDCTKQLRFSSLAEYVDAVRPVLRRAVRNRIRSNHPVAMTVSGGFDSSLLYALAQELRSGEARGGPITGLSLLYKDCPPAREEQFLEPLEERFGARIMRFQVQPGIMNFARQTVYYGEMPLLRLHGDSEYVKWQAARELGARTLLDGWFGDQLTYSFGYWIDLLRSGNLRQLWSSLRGYSEWFNMRGPTQWLPSLIMLSRILASPRPVRKPLRWLRYRSARNLQPGWYTRRFARIGTERAIHQEGDIVQKGWYHSRHLHDLARNPYYCKNQEMLAKIGAAFGLQQSSPFYDRELIQLVMSIPGAVVSWNNEPRGLFREIARGIIPEPIRTRNWKANFGGFVLGGIAQHLDEAQQMLNANSMCAQFGYVELRCVAGEAAHIRQRLAAGDRRMLDRIVAIIGLELWLQTFFNGEAVVPPLGESRPLIDSVALNGSKAVSG